MTANMKPFYYCNRVALSAAMLLLLVPLQGYSSDAAKEKRLAEQTLQTLFIGEEIWLQADQTAFLALYEKGEDGTPAILLVHGTGQGPDTTAVIGPLREAFSELGITTLSLQMPVLGETAEYQDYTAVFPNAAKRIKAGVDYLSAEEDLPIIVIGHSMGASMVMGWLTPAGPPKGIDAIITLGLGSTPQVWSAEQWNNIRVPFYDIVGQNDFPSVLERAPARTDLVVSTHPQSEQIVITGADHFYTGRYAELVAKIVALID